MTTIKNVQARQILDSRGNPTVEVDLWTDDFMARAAVPSGASTGAHEAVELRDGGSGWCGKGVLKAVENVNGPLKELLIGDDVFEQTGLDQKMVDLDGTDNKSKLGANAILGCSLAIAKVAAMEKGVAFYEYLAAISGTKEVSLPVPMMNIINGGAHADNSLDIQEFMLVPQADSFSEELRIGVETFHSLKALLQERNLSTAVGDEGGFAPCLRTNEEAIGLILEAAENAGHADNVKIALDCAASEFYTPYDPSVSRSHASRQTGATPLQTPLSGKTGHLPLPLGHELGAEWSGESLDILGETRYNSGYYTLDGEMVGSEKLIEYYAYLCKKYPIVSIEDPLFEDDWEGWVKLTAKLGSSVQIVGDDLLVTNVERLKKAIDLKACNAILVKPNQIGTLSETIEAIQLAHEYGFKAVVSHRSGETEDTSIADLAVGLATGQIKTGSLSRTDRVCKYNRLLRIEEALA